MDSAALLPPTEVAGFECGAPPLLKSCLPRALALAK